MFLPAMFLVVVGCLISGVVYSRYRCAEDARSFFRSGLFRAFSASVFITLAAAFVVNLVAPEKKKSLFVIAADSLSAIERDTSASNLLSKPPQFHYSLLQKLNTFERYQPYLKSVKRQYTGFLGDGRTKDQGAFGLGLIYTLEDKYDSALVQFATIGNSNYPFVHFLKADIAFELGQPDLAEHELQAELRIEGGNYREAYLKLMDLYDGAHDFDRLGDLLRMNLSETLFPDHLARKTLLHSGDAGAYVKKLLLSVHAQVKGYGLAAAFLIFSIWIIYLVKLDIFRGRRIGGLLLMAVAGSVSVLAIIAINDAFDLVSAWSRNGELINDLLYCILMIGAPEELVKFLPLLGLIAMRGKFADPFDYIRYACATAIGFAFLENLLYFQDVNDGIIHVRGYLAAVAHMTDATIVAFGVVYIRFLDDRKLPSWLIMLTAFTASVLSHGIYDFLLYHHWYLVFTIFFLFTVVIWMRIIASCLNNSQQFSTRKIAYLKDGSLFLATSLTSLFAFEYMLIGFSSSRDHANSIVIVNGSSALVYIFFLSCSLFRLNLQQGIWLPLVPLPGFGISQLCGVFRQRYFRVRLPQDAAVVETRASDE
jgi:RsiW-degrading membrane proteinase PrsW (M82 family)